MAVFAYASARVWRWAGAGPGWRRVAAVLAVDPLMWAGTEVARGWLLSGFAGNFLGVSQVATVPQSQAASLAPLFPAGGVGGGYGVSALLVLANGAVASMVERAAWPFVARLTQAADTARLAGWPARVWRSSESFLPLAVVIGFWFWGLDRVGQWRRQEASVPSWRVALIQPNSPCIFTINSETMRRQLELLVSQTRLAGAARPELVVWPETAVLGSVPYEPQTMAMIREGAAAAGAPLLTGTLEVEHTPVTRAAPEGLLYYNAAWLFSAEGDELGRYRKRHLVPFGEYLPVDKTLPWLLRRAPTGLRCTPGRGPGVLRLPRGPEAGGGELRMGPLICFEDTVPALSREAVRAGARLLVLMTNDAWFNGSVEPLQHLDQSIFRAVENGVPLVRAANSGVTCAVDAVGRVKRLESEGAATDFDGFLVMPVAVADTPLAAPYTRWGDRVLGLPGAVLLLALLATGARRRVAARSVAEEKQTDCEGT
jgi:apolipoprotein N-acyltransferase